MPEGKWNISQDWYFRDALRITWFGSFRSIQMEQSHAMTHSENRGQPHSAQDDNTHGA